MGQAYLRAFAATKDDFYLRAAREAAEALVDGQLQSGGWTQVIHFVLPERGRMGRYRRGEGTGRVGSWNVSSLDDGQTQAALQFLMRTDKVLGFQHEGIHEAVTFGMKALLDAQFPNGGFPQVWTGRVEAKPVVEAQYPEGGWKSAARIKNYWDGYTLNDGVAGTVAATLMLAFQIYENQEYHAAVRRLGDFLILAQMPEPGWCQQHNDEMIPMWARKFEPPAIAGTESQDVMETLIKIARFTDDQRYLEPISTALEYFKQRCVLRDGRLARFHELKTNRPLYMDSDYQITYDDSEAPSHYGWKHPARLEKIEEAFRAAQENLDQPSARSSRPREREVREILAKLDEQGRWITNDAGEHLVGQPKFESGFRFLSSAVFSKNVETLSAYLSSMAEALEP